jgi:NhaP-type Na+/H+ and K+/H+ antiporter
MVAVTAAVAGDQSSYGNSLSRFVEELGFGLVAGIAGGLVLLWDLRATRHFEAGVQAVVVLLGAVLLAQ